MKKRLLFASLLLTIDLLAATPNGTVVVAIGKSLKSQKNDKVVQMSKNDSVFNGDLINTQAASYLKLLMKDDTIIGVSEKTSFLIENMKIVKGERVLAQFSQKGGTVRVNVTKKTNKPSIKFKTPDLELDILGTEFISRVINEAGKIKTEIHLLSGLLKAKNINTGEEFNIRPQMKYESKSTMVLPKGNAKKEVDKGSLTKIDDSFLKSLQANFEIPNDSIFATVESGESVGVDVNLDEQINSQQDAQVEAQVSASLEAKVNVEVANMPEMAGMENIDQGAVMLNESYLDSMDLNNMPYYIPLYDGDEFDYSDIDNPPGANCTALPDPPYVICN